VGHLDFDEIHDFSSHVHARALDIFATNHDLPSLSLKGAERRVRGFDITNCLSSYSFYLKTLHSINQNIGKTSHHNNPIEIEMEIRLA
jgi:hypothetical protein